MRREFKTMFVLLLILALAASCASDPTTSEEYQNLEADLAVALEEAADLQADLDAVRAEVAAWAEMPADAMAAFDGYTEAVLSADGDKMMEFVTADFQFLSYGTDVQLGQDRADYVTSYYGDFEMEELGEHLILGGGDVYLVATPEMATTGTGIVEGFSVVRLVNQDGEWLVDAHRFTGE